MHRTSLSIGLALVALRAPWWRRQVAGPCECAAATAGDTVERPA